METFSPSKFGPATGVKPSAAERQNRSKPLVSTTEALTNHNSEIMRSKIAPHHSIESGVHWNYRGGSALKLSRGASLLTALLWSNPVGARRRRPLQRPLIEQKHNAPITPIQPLLGDSAPLGVINTAATGSGNESHSRGKPGGLQVFLEKKTWWSRMVRACCSYLKGGRKTEEKIFTRAPPPSKGK